MPIWGVHWALIVTRLMHSIKSTQLKNLIIVFIVDLGKWIRTYKIFEKII